MIRWSILVSLTLCWVAFGQAPEQSELEQSAVDHFRRGEFATAGPLYEQLSGQLNGPPAQKAAMRAAYCFEQSDEPASALRMYHRTVSIGLDHLTPRYWKTDGISVTKFAGDKGAIRTRIIKSLYRQAELYKHLGEQANCTKAIRELWVHDPTSPYVTSTIALLDLPDDKRQQLSEAQEEAAERLYDRL